MTNRLVRAFFSPLGVCIFSLFVSCVADAAFGDELHLSGIFGFLFVLTLLVAVVVGASAIIREGARLWSESDEHDE